MVYSMIQKSQLEGALRLDAEYYQPEYLELEHELNLLQTVTLDSLSTKITQGPNPVFVEMGKTCLNGRNVKGRRVVLDNPNYVAKAEFNLLSRYKISKGDILITLKGLGSIGKIGYVFNNCEAIFSRDVGLVRARERSEYIYAFLFSKYGTFQIERSTTGGTGQLTLTTNYIKQFRVPRYDELLTREITFLIRQSETENQNSTKLYSEAENLLLEELGLKNYKVEDDLSFVVKLSDVKSVGRSDAEYFQPKYEELITTVKKYEGGFDALENLAKIKDKNFTPKDKEAYKYIDLANISSNGEINGYEENFGKELPSRARRKVQKGDVIISSIEGSLESIALITENWVNALCSTGFFTVNSDKINSETLLVVLKTKIGQMQLKKGCKGTILTAVGKDEFSKIVLPMIDPKIQNQIKEKITEMYATKKLSKSLLEIAKRGVEMAIEKGEKESEKLIDAELAKLEIKL